MQYDGKLCSNNKINGNTFNNYFASLMDKMAQNK